MKNLTILIISAILSSTLSFGQNKIMMVNGETTNASSIDGRSTKKGSTISLVVDGENKSIPKNNILCVIPEGKKGFTFSSRNNVKANIPKKDIKNNYQGTDIPHLYAHKYFKSKLGVEDLYKLNPGMNLSFDDFESAYYEQEQRLRTRNTINKTVSTVSTILLTTLIIL
ncbi:MAG: hypothetical protein R2764_03370 [Bacteroidales bacterium]